MTEAEWLASEDPARMLVWLGAPHPAGVSGTGGGKPYSITISGRKLRLFVNAAARPAYTQVILGTEDESYEQYGEKDWASIAHQWASPLGAVNIVGTILPVEMARRANLLGDIVGNPFRPVTLPKVLTPAPPPTAPGHCTVHCPWLTPTVLSLAHAAYDERGRVCEKCKGAKRGEQRFESLHPYNRALAGYQTSRCTGCNGTGRIDDGTLDSARLAVLSDALEEAGCADEAILSHLRSPGPHVRGCWVLDLILGKS